MEACALDKGLSQHFLRIAITASAYSAAGSCVDAECTACFQRGKFACKMCPITLIDHGV